MPARVKPIAWQPHDRAVPLGQGDLVLVAWAKTISPEEARSTQAQYPSIGTRDAFDHRYWADSPAGTAPPQVLEMWGRMNYSLGVVMAEGCAIDKEYNTLRANYIDAGMDANQATTQALRNVDAFVTVAEAWPVEAFPPHLQRDAESGSVGYAPFAVPDWLGDSRTYAVDLNRISTVSWRALDQRIAMVAADPAWRQRLQSQLCRYFASRTIRISADLQDIFQEPILSAEAVGVPAGNPPRVRVRLHFENGRSVDLEAIQTATADDDPDEDKGPGLHTRR